MNVLIAKWFNNFGEEVVMDIYPESVPASEILDAYTNYKIAYGRKVIAETNSYVLYDDGVRLETYLHPVKFDITAPSEVIDGETIRQIE